MVSTSLSQQGLLALYCCEKYELTNFVKLCQDDDDRVKFEVEDEEGESAEEISDHDTLILDSSQVRFRQVFLWLKFHQLDFHFKIYNCVRLRKKLI